MCESGKQQLVLTDLASSDLTPLELTTTAPYAPPTKPIMPPIQLKTHKKGLCRLLQDEDRLCLEAQVGLEVPNDLTDQALEGQLADQQVGGLLVLADLAQGHCARAIPAARIESCERGKPRWHALPYPCCAPVGLLDDPALGRD